MILKVGGSVLTDKTGERELDRQSFRRALDAVAGAPGDLVLVHGAGSYGHPQAERHALHEGGREGVFETHSAVADLNRLVVDYLRDAGVNALPVHPLSCGVKNPELEVYDEAVRLMAREGFLPVLHGDGVTHEGVGVSVVSGDDLVVELAERGERVGMCTSAGGVLDRGGEVLDRVSTMDEVEELGGEGADVTGGILAKVRKLLELPSGGYVFGVDGIEEFLRGGEPGTHVRRS